METYVYRHFDANNVLLYVGMAANVQQRTKQHKTVSPWAQRIARTAVKGYRTRLDAAIAELQAIAKEQPLYNVVPGDERRRKLDNAVMFSVRLPENLLARVLTACENKEISKSEFVRAALEKALVR